MRKNPFHELYLAEQQSESEFVELFSDILVPHVQLMFQPGNVVVIGMIGSGKSMLLKLLQLDTRLMYLRAGSMHFPVPKNFRKFISCEINLAHSGAIDFGYRSYEGMTALEVEGLFGDFVNTYLVRDLFNNFLKLTSPETHEVNSEIGFNYSAEKFSKFAKDLIGNGFGHGWFEGVTTIEAMIARLTERIRVYASFFASRIDKLTDEVLVTRSLIGEQFGDLVDGLKNHKIISSETHVFVDIDQYEELDKIASGAESERKIDFRSVIHRALARRDPRVSFRVGARKHSWAGHLKVMGSNGKLEENRDYKLVNLDQLFKREENVKLHVFPKFVEDIFRRRLQVAGFKFQKVGSEIEAVYGRSLSADEKAKEYAGLSRGAHIETKTKVISLESSWSRTTQDRLLTLAKSDPLSARLGEAWVRQKGEKFNCQVGNEQLPWEKSKWWKKERLEVAQMQIAARLQQRAKYSGHIEIIDLSGINVLTFISINQHIWDEYFRYQTTKGAFNSGDVSNPIQVAPSIPPEVQQVGIIRASRHWYSGLVAESGRSSQRYKFLEAFARHLRTKLMSDKRMSYPGASGFSLELEELEKFPAVKALLEELVDYGNLTEVSHTTKEANRARRLKWYLSATLCPELGLPYKHVKEPRYMSVKEVLEIAGEARVDLSSFGALFSHTQSRLL